MTELKTLKDLETNLNEKCAFEGIELVHIQEIIRQLKAEAIKWVKAIAQGTADHIWFRISDEETAKQVIIQNQFTIRWIKHFFNLTEEDLK